MTLFVQPKVFCLHPAVVCPFLSLFTSYWAETRFEEPRLILHWAKICWRAHSGSYHAWKCPKVTHFGATIVFTGCWCVDYGSFVCPRAPQHAPSHPAGSLRNPHIELIITSQPLPSLITHILKQVEQSIPALDADCGGRTVASAFKIASIFCVCVKDISILARRLCSTGPWPVSRGHNCILPG